MDNKILQQKSMLNDRIINAAQKLIKNKFPQVGGLQDPVLSQTSFECCPGEGVQIHNTGKTHWVTSSSMGGQPIAVYDSLFNDLTESTEKQLAECYRGFIDVASQLRIEMCPAQLQKGSVDCGLFAIAYAYELASGNTYLNEVSFDQSKMRNHLFGCFERGEISPFPRSCGTGALRVNGPNELVIQTFCTCCLPEYGDMVTIIQSARVRLEMFVTVPGVSPSTKNVNIINNLDFALCEVIKFEILKSPTVTSFVVQNAVGFE